MLLLRTFMIIKLKFNNPCTCVNYALFSYIEGFWIPCSLCDSESARFPCKKNIIDS